MTGSCSISVNQQGHQGARHGGQATLTCSQTISIGVEVKSAGAPSRSASSPSKEDQGQGGRRKPGGRKSAVFSDDDELEFLLTVA
jgi:hypothetical protein